MSATANSNLESLIRAMTPDEAARAAAVRHRKELEDCLTADVGIVRMRETGSWHHGTALGEISDVDYFATMPGPRPTSSSTALERLREALSRGISGAYVSVDRPAVRLHYYDGPDVEITPAYYQDADDYDIPDPVGTGWIRSNPAVHLAYVNKAQQETGGRAKSLIRLVKTWRAFNRVPLSSFYLEMRTAQYAARHAPIIYDWDLRGFFKSLSSSGISEMNDPTNYGRRISTGATSLVDSIAAKYAVEEAARMAALAREAAEADNHSAAIGHHRRLFNVQS